MHAHGASDLAIGFTALIAVEYFLTLVWIEPGVFGAAWGGCRRKWWLGELTIGAKRIPKGDELRQFVRIKGGEDRHVYSSMFIVEACATHTGFCVFMIITATYRRGPPGAAHRCRVFRSYAWCALPRHQSGELACGRVPRAWQPAHAGQTAGADAWLRPL